MVLPSFFTFPGGGVFWKVEEVERKVLGRGRASGPTEREKDGKCDHGDIWRCENNSVYGEGRGGDRWEKG